MDSPNRSGRLEDSRFKEVPLLKKKQAPHQLHWFLDEDYFSGELLGFHPLEVKNLMDIATDAFAVFQQATAKIIGDRELYTLGIPRWFEDCIYHSWKHRDKHPFFLGRFDINGGFGNGKHAVIEFNADTFSTLPETMHWQALQLQQLKGNPLQFNELGKYMAQSLKKIADGLNLSNPVILGSSFGYKEDVLNANTVLDIAHSVGYHTQYLDLEHVTFSEEGIFYELGDEYVKADVWYKIIPWDWMFNEEPELAKIMSYIILNDLAVVLNPPYTTIWQNKLFLAYITKHFPNQVIAETYADNNWSLTSSVKKPVYGRLGENVIVKDDSGKEVKSKGDYGDQKVVHQKYYPLPADAENYFYQVGIFYADKPAALNVRAQDGKILTDDCEFMSHYIIY